MRGYRILQTPLLSTIPGPVAHFAGTAQSHLFAPSQESGKPHHTRGVPRIANQGLCIGSQRCVDL